MSSSDPAKPNATSTVAIFWDYENCEVPGSADASTIASGICQLAQEHGEITSFRAYLQVSDFTSARSTDTLLKLQRCGVSLLDCDHDGRKDVADKKILVDMFAHAMDKPESTIVLISGDRDFFHAISVLQLRKFKIVLMSPSSARPGLRTSSTLWYEWPRAILQAGELADPELASNGAHQRSMSAHAIPKLLTPEDSATLINLPTSPVSPPSLPPSPATSAQHGVFPSLPSVPREPIYCFTGTTYGRARNNATESPRTMPTTTLALPPASPLTVTNTTCARPPPTPRTLPATSRALPPPSPCTSLAALSWANIAARGRQSEPTSRDAQVPRSNEPSRPSGPWRSSRVLASKSEFSSKLSNVTTLQYETHNRDGESPASEDRFPPLQGVTNEEQPLETPGLLLELHSQTYPQVSEPSSLGLQGLAGLDAAAQGSPSTHGVEPPPILSEGWHNDGSPIHPHIRIPTHVMIRGRKPPQKYKLLVRVLEQERLSGQTRIAFSQLGSLLKKEHPSFLQRAGVDKLKEMIAMAEKDHIVIVGKEDSFDHISGRNKNNGNSWAALHPIFHGIPFERVPFPSLPIYDQEPVA